MKIIIFILGLAIGIFFLQKYYPEKSQSIEIKSENSNIISEQESDENTENAKDIENSEVKKEETEKVAVDIPNKTEKAVPPAVSEEKKGINIISKLVSWGYEKSDYRTIDTIIIHSSYNALGGDEYDVEGLIKEYKKYEVSPHYLIDRKGKIYRLVADKNIAYHAGVSQVPDGRKGVNNFSIGIELMNNKEDKYTSEQYATLKKLIESLKGDYKIKYVLGHNQIAPGRKTDPWNFDWEKI